ncbi:MAG: hypothetical protein QF562_04800, partial [Verrucomicrobiota bacterium]|nr:hypothetical protein [Verrucomicrobiota bacterium]
MPLPPFQRRYRKRTRRLGPKDQVLRDWRGLDVGPLEKAHANRAVNAEAVVKSVLGSLKLEQR